MPPYDATVITKLKAVDYVMTGKMNMDEFAMGSSCENSAFHITHNPHGLDKVPGGSSGGSAAAVAAGEAVLTLGSDTGGSIREPAAYCGIIGLKAHLWRGKPLRLGGVCFLAGSIGPMGRSVEDVANLFYTISGQDPYDATSMPTHYPKTAEGLEYDLAGLRIGVPKEFYNACGCSGRCCHLAGYPHAGGPWRQGGGYQPAQHRVRPFRLLHHFLGRSFLNLSRFDGVKYGFRAENYTDLNDMYEKTRSEGFGDEVKRRIMLGTFVLSSGYYDAYYKKAKLFQQKVRAEYDEAFKQCDVIVTPTAPTAAFKIGENVHDPLKMYASDILHHYCEYCRPAGAFCPLAWTMRCRWECSSLGRTSPRRSCLGLPRGIRDPARRPVQGSHCGVRREKQHEIRNCRWSGSPCGAEYQDQRSTADAKTPSAPWSIPTAVLSAPVCPVLCPP